MIARIRRLTANDSAQRASWIRAYRWARNCISDHTVHVESHSLPLFPLGSLEAAAALSDSEFAAFISWLCFARAQYIAFD